MHNENNHIDNDRNLKNLPTEGGFGVPQGYFENMRNRILRETTGLEADTTFSVPDGYFESARKAILAQTTAATPTLKVWYTRTLVKYAAAAVVILASTLVWRIANQPHTSDIQSMSNEDIIRYFEEEGVRDIPVSEVSFALTETPANGEEKYLINHADEQSIIEEL